MINYFQKNQLILLLSFILSHIVFSFAKIMGEMAFWLLSVAHLAFLSVAIIVLVRVYRENKGLIATLKNAQASVLVMLMSLACIMGVFFDSPLGLILLLGYLPFAGLLLLGRQSDKGEVTKSQIVGKILAIVCSFGFVVFFFMNANVGYGKHAGVLWIFFLIFLFLPYVIAILVAKPRKARETALYFVMVSVLIGVGVLNPWIGALASVFIPFAGYLAFFARSNKQIQYTSIGLCIIYALLSPYFILKGTDIGKTLDDPCYERAQYSKGSEWHVKDGIVCGVRDVNGIGDGVYAEVQGADAETFEGLGWGYHKDKNYLYYNFKPLSKSLDQFERFEKESISGFYRHDGKRVFHQDEVISELSPSDVIDGFSSYLVTKKGVYWDGKKLTNTKPQSIQRMDEHLVIPEGVFRYGVRLDLDPETTQMVDHKDDFYMKDKDSVFRGDEEVMGVNAERFRELPGKGSFHSDGEKFFYLSFAVPGLDVKNACVLGEFVSDGKNVYDGRDLVEGEDKVSVLKSYSLVRQRDYEEKCISGIFQ